MKININEPKSKPRATCGQMAFGEIYRAWRDPAIRTELFCMRVHLGESGSRVINVRTGEQLASPHDYSYENVEAVLQVS